MIHIMVGDEAAKNLEAAFALDENLKGDILVLKDTLGIGPLQVNEEDTHDSVRTDFWKQINPAFDGLSDDESRVKAVIEKAHEEEEPLCIWIAPCVSDVCAYYWMQTLCAAYPGMLHTINIIGLPFLNEKGQLFYPANFSQVPAKEFVKTKRLLKEVTPAEYEMEGDEWKRLQEEDGGVRMYEGGKKIVSKSEDYFDTSLKNSISAEFLKAPRIVHEAQKKITQTLSHFYLEHRLRLIIQSEAYELSGLPDGVLKDLMIKKRVAATAENTEVGNVQ